MIVLHNVALPIEVNDRFCTPDFYNVLEYWPSYYRHVVREGRFQPLDRIEYLNFIIDEIVKSKIRPDRNRIQWKERIIEYFGGVQLREWIGINDNTPIQDHGER